MNSLRSPLTACASPLNHRCRLQRNAGPLSHQRNVWGNQGGASGAPYCHASRRRSPKGIQERRGRREGKTEGHSSSEWARQGAKFDHTDTSHGWSRERTQAREEHPWASQAVFSEPERGEVLASRSARSETASRRRVFEGSAASRPATGFRDFRQATSGGRRARIQVYCAAGPSPWTAGFIAFALKP
jgi:hypothetical protein